MAAIKRERVEESDGGRDQGRDQGRGGGKEG